MENIKIGKRDKKDICNCYYIIEIPAEMIGSDFIEL